MIVYVTQLEGALNADQQEYTTILSASEAKKILEGLPLSWALQAVVQFHMLPV